MCEWTIADHVESPYRNYYKLVYHNHDEFWFTCLNLKAGPQCGLCGTLVPNYLLVQMNLLSDRKSWYSSYMYKPNFPYQVKCIYKGKVLAAYITDDGYYVANAEEKKVRDFWNQVVPQYKHIWQEIL